MAGAADLLMVLVTLAMVAIPVIMVVAYIAGFLVFMAIFLAGLVLWIKMLMDCIKREEFQIKGDNAQLIWILILLFGGVIGAVLYYFLEKKKSEMPKKATQKPVKPLN